MHNFSDLVQGELLNSGMNGGGRKMCIFQRITAYLYILEMMRYGQGYY